MDQATHDKNIADDRRVERQFRLAPFEHAVLSPPELLPAVREIHGEVVAGAFKDAYA